MQNQTTKQDELQIQRVLASIAFSDNEIDEQERKILASTIGDTSQLSEEQLSTIIDDAVKTPKIENLVAEITEPMTIRYLIFNLMALAVVKNDWKDIEISTARRVIDAIRLPQESIPKVRKAFDLLFDINKST